VVTVVGSGFFVYILYQLGRAPGKKSFFKDPKRKMVLGYLACYCVIILYLIFFRAYMEAILDDIYTSSAEYLECVSLGGGESCKVNPPYNFGIYVAFVTCVSGPGIIVFFGWLSFPHFRSRMLEILHIKKKKGSTSNTRSRSSKSRSLGPRTQTNTYQAPTARRAQTIEISDLESTLENISPVSTHSDTGGSSEDNVNLPKSMFRSSSSSASLKEEDGENYSGSRETSAIKSGDMRESSSFSEKTNTISRRRSPIVYASSMSSTSSEESSAEEDSEDEEERN